MWRDVTKKDWPPSMKITAIDLSQLAVSMRGAEPEAAPHDHESASC